MAKTCSACGGPMADTQTFCSSCGTKWTAAAESKTKFCIGCGMPLERGTKFCAKCGRAVEGVAMAARAGASAAGSSPATAATPSSVALPATQKSGGGAVKVIVAVLGIFMFMGLLGMGSCAYLAYRAKQKVEGLKDEYENNPTDKYASALEKQAAKAGNSSSPSSSSSSGGDSSSSSSGANGAAALIGLAASALNGSSSSNDATSSQPELPHWKSYSGSPVSGDGSLVPLKPGLTDVSAVSAPSWGDYEAIVTVNQVAKDGVLVGISSQAPPPNSTAVGGGKATTGKSFQAIETRRKVLAQDMAAAHELYFYFSKSDPLTFPGTTSDTVSKEVFNELKSKGDTPLRYKIFTAKGALSGLLNKLSNPQQGSEGLDLQNLSGSLMTKIDCTLRKAETNDVGFPVILNDKPVEVPAIHGICKGDQDELHLWVLDDAQYPLVLAFSSKAAQGRAQMVKINFPEDQAVNHIEQALKQTGHVQIYGINFDFASATIRPQSQTVLAEIAKAMKDNPSWKLSVNGHTDNIGGDASNLELSKKRSAAVVQALTTHYQIGANRLTSSGSGASSPIDTNDTIEGRARNRRVELVLQ